MQQHTLQELQEQVDSLNEKLQQAQLNLERSEKEYQMMFDAFPDLYFRVSKDGKYLDYEVGRYHIDKLFVSPDTFMGKYIHEIMPPNISRLQQDAIQKCIENDEITSFEYSLPVPSGDLWFECRIVKLNENEVGCHVREITGAKQNEFALKDRIQDLEQFTYMISHDLLEPVRMVNSFSTLLENEIQDLESPKANKFLRFIVDHSKRLKTLISDLSLYTRVANSEIPFEEFDFKTLVENRVALMTSDLESDNFDILISEALHSVPARQAQIGIVFHNLIHNGLKFNTSERPKILINSSESEHTIEYQIIDNGIGIDEQYKDDIFDLFKRLNTKDRFPGSGIGLSLCHKIIEEHKGKIWFTSNSTGGCTFHFTLPKQSS